MSDANIRQSHRRTVSYIDKSREYYAAHGYKLPYQWASFRTVPFTPPPNLTAATVGVVTTSFPVGADMPRKVQAHRSHPVPDTMFTKDLSWDKDATHTNDVGSFLPITSLDRLVDGGAIEAVSERFYCVPTEYSQRRTMASAEQILSWACEDSVDVMLLVPL